MMTADWVTSESFIDVFDTNLQLLTEVRDYLQNNIDTNMSANKDSDSKKPISKDQENTVPLAKLTATREASRLTSMLAESMSWLLLNKALHNNELSLEKLLEESTSLCELIGSSAEDQPKIVDDLPEVLHQLFEKSNILFVKVHTIINTVRTVKN